MEKIILILFLLQFSVYGQFTNSDYELVKTTFTREFNDEIISKYLSSPNDSSVVAGLLSISNSRDTSFASKITGLNFNKYGKYISFALGELGSCKSSQTFLLNKILSGDSCSSNNLLEAFGKICDSTSFNIVIDKYFELDKNHFSGISTALLNYYRRGFKIDSLKLYNLLDKELKGNNYDRKKSALFTSYRIGSSPDLKDEFVNILENNSDNNCEIACYALNNLRVLKYFPDDYNLFSELINSSSWNVRCEAARTLCYTDFNDSVSISKYLGLILDENPNVSLAAALSIKKIKINQEQKLKLLQKIKIYLKQPEIPSNTRGELFVSLNKLSEENLYDFIDEYEDDIPREYIYKSLAENSLQPEDNFDFIKNELEDINERELVKLLPAILALKKEFIHKADYQRLLLSLLNSDFPSAISIVADAVDSNMINLSRSDLQQIIVLKSFEKRNDPDFIESMFAYEVLASKMSDVFHEELLKILNGSNLYSVKSYAYKKLGKDITGLTKPLNNFDKIWSYAYKFNKAEIKTERGTFVIEFSPQFAPVSTGNFCYLAENGFYNGVSFHRVVSNFVIQTGDQSGTGWGGPGYEIITELAPLPFLKASVGMASAGIDTEGSQWFVMHSAYPHLDGNYSNFGYVVSGFDTISKIEQNDNIIKVTLIEK